MRISISPINKQYNYNPQFNGVTEVLSEKFIKTQEEIITEFCKDKASQGIAGTLPPYWLAKLQGLPVEIKDTTIQKVLLAFRSAIKYLRPYNAPVNSKEYRQVRADAENRRLKEASAFLTKSLRHFGILSETNSVNFKRLKVKGHYMERGYVLREKGENPTLEQLFIKKFKHINPMCVEANSHGKYSELAHGLFLNHSLNTKFISKFYWGDTQASYMATEYQVPPIKVSPIVKLKAKYPTKCDFIKDLYRQTGITSKVLEEYNVNVGKTLENGEFIPLSKDDIIITLYQKMLDKIGLVHLDLHNLNAVIGSTKTKQPIVKLIDVGGLFSIT